MITKIERRLKIKYRVRNKVAGTAERPRMSVFRSNKQIYVQVIDDDAQKTLVAASSLGLEKMNKSEQAAKVGALVAKKALDAGISTVVFDRNGYLYHGRVKAVAEAAQTTGLVGNLSAEDIKKTPDGCYVLVDGVLRQVQGGTAYIQTNRAYFKLDDVAEYSEDEPTAGVKLINISFNEDATAINGINATTADGTIYNLQGQRVNSLQRGINVVNGKKVLVK